MCSGCPEAVWHQLQFRAERGLVELQTWQKPPSNPEMNFTEPRVRISIYHPCMQFKRQKIKQRHLRGSSVGGREPARTRSTDSIISTTKATPEQRQSRREASPPSRNIRQHWMSSPKKTLPSRAPHAENEAGGGLFATASFQGLCKKGTIIKMSEEGTVVPTLQTTTSKLSRLQVWPRHLMSQPVAT